MKQPPRIAHWLLLQFLRRDLGEDVCGDLAEKFEESLATQSRFRASLGYWCEVIHYFRPFAIRKFKTTHSNGMFKSYFNSAFRNLRRERILAFINISGLSLGMTIALFIGLWIHDEFTFDRTNPHYNRVVQIMQNVTNNGEVQTWTSIPWPLAAELRNNYGADFENVVLSTGSYNHLLSTESKKFSKSGRFAERGFEEIFSVPLISGTRLDLGRTDQLPWNFRTRLV